MAQISQPVNAPAISYDDVKKAALALQTKKGRATLVKVLEGQQLKTAQEAKPEQYQALIDACNTAAIAS